MSSTRIIVLMADLRIEQLATDGLNNLHSELTVFADFLCQMTYPQLAYLVRILN